MRSLVPRCSRRSHELFIAALPPPGVQNGPGSQSLGAASAWYDVRHLIADAFRNSGLVLTWAKSFDLFRSPNSSGPVWFGKPAPCTRAYSRRLYRAAKTGISSNKSSGHPVRGLVSGRCRNLTGVRVAPEAPDAVTGTYDSANAPQSCAAKRSTGLGEPQFANGSGRNWMCTARGIEPLPPSLSHGVRSPFVLHKPRPFQPALGSSIRPSKPLA